MRLSPPSPICKGKQEKAAQLKLVNLIAFSCAFLGMGEGGDSRMRASYR